MHQEFVEIVDVTSGDRYSLPIDEPIRSADGLDIDVGAIYAPPPSSGGATLRSVEVGEAFLLDGGTGYGEPPGRHTWWLSRRLR